MLILFFIREVPDLLPFSKHHALIWTSSQTRVLQFLRLPELFTLVSDLRVSQTHYRFCAIWCRVYSLYHSYIAKSAKSHFYERDGAVVAFQRVVTLLQLQLRLRFHMQQRRLGHLQVGLWLEDNDDCSWVSGLNSLGSNFHWFLGSLGSEGYIIVLQKALTLERKVILFLCNFEVEVLVSLHYAQLRCCQSTLVHRLVCTLVRGSFSLPSSDSWTFELVLSRQTLDLD